MSGITKWITGGLGFVLGGPIGALIGFWIGSLLEGSIKTFDSSSQQTTSSRSYGPSTAEGDFKMSLLVLIAVVMKADGRAQKKELDVAKRFLVINFGEAGALEALQILKNLLQQPINEIEVAQQIGRYMNYSSRLELMHFLFEIALADHEVVPQEQQVLQRIALNMGISQADFNALQAPYFKTKDANWAYTALEIEPSATDDEIKKAYRRMAMKYHPDKVTNLGEDVKRKATEKFRSLNEAYEELKKQRGIN